LIITLSRKKKKKRSKKKKIQKKIQKKKSFLVVETVTANGEHPIIDSECPSVIHGPPLQFHEVTPGNGIRIYTVVGGVGVVGAKFVTVYNFGVLIALVFVKVIGTALVRRLDVVEADRDRFENTTIATNGTIATNTTAIATIATIAIIIGETVKGNKPPLELEVTPGEVTPGEVTPGEVTPTDGVGGAVEIVQVVLISSGDAIGVDIITEYVIVLVKDVVIVVDVGFLRGAEGIRADIAIVRTAIARTTFIEVYGGDFLSSRDGVGESESR